MKKVKKTRAARKPAKPAGRGAPKRTSVKKKTSVKSGGKVSKKKPEKVAKTFNKIVKAPIAKVAPGKTKFTPTRRKLTAAEIREFKNTLINLADRLSGQIRSLKSDSLKRTDEVNTSEDGTDAFERQFALNIASTENDALFEIDAALRRVEDGTYGACETTGEPIELERLKAIPYTRYSLGAQAELERGRAPHRQSSVQRDF